MYTNLNHINLRGRVKSKTYFTSQQLSIIPISKSIFVIILIFTVPRVYAQGTIDSILANIARNNKTLQVQSKYWDAQKLEYNTGISLYDPMISYDFIRGTPNAIAGNQTDINVVQRFDFPTVYDKKRKLALEQSKQAVLSFTASRQQILFQAKIICIELVYRNKLQEEIEKRKSKTEKFLIDFQTKLDNGEGNILDVNKAKLQLIEFNKDYQLNISSINQLNHKLTELNGGVEIDFTDTEYSSNLPLVSFEELAKDIEITNPIRKYLEQEKVIAQKQIEVTKAMTLPKFEAGYHYQGILGQNFHGARVGTSIPLWENKNRIKHKQAELSLAEGQLNEYTNTYYYEIKQLYEKYVNLQKTIAEYRIVLNGMNSIALLDKALAAGEITTIQYFLETSYLYAASNNLLLVEKEFYEVLAELYKYQV